MEMKSTISKNSLLIIGDDSSSITTLYSALGSDYFIFAIEDGRKAVNTVKKKLPDLILLDIIMPEMNGFEVIKAIKSEKEIADIPVIIISGMSGTEYEKKGLAAGAADYIHKPFSEDILKLRVRNQMRIIRDLNMTDALTGVSNRRGFDAELRYEWSRSARDGMPISLLMIDIDHFKKYNDKYGHIMGDIALKAVANIIKQNIHRSTDFIARWGGEEFAVLLPKADILGALRVAERIRTDIENCIIRLEDSTATSVTVSIGIICTIPRFGGFSDSFVAGADKALCRAKETGRNRAYTAPIIAR